MANQDRPRGFEPRDEVKQAKRYVAGAKIVAGEMVQLSADGKVDPATSVSICLGVALSTALSVDDKILIADSPDQQYLVQADGADINTNTDIGLRYNVLPTAENTVYNVARMEMDSSTGVTTASQSGALKLIGIQDGPNNDFGTNVDCVVIINVHALGSDSLGI